MASPGKRIRARWDMGIDGWKADDDHEASERGGIIQTERGGKKGAALSLIFLRPSFFLDVTAAGSLEGNWNSTNVC